MICNLLDVVVGDILIGTTNNANINKVTDIGFEWEVINITTYGISIKCIKLPARRTTVAVEEVREVHRYDFPKFKFELLVKGPLTPLSKIINDVYEMEKQKWDIVNQKSVKKSKLL